MKIAQVVCVFPPYKGGIGNVAWQYARRLSDRGETVFVFVPGRGKTKIEDAQEGLVIFRLRSLIKFGHAAFLPQLFCMLRDFEVVHLHYPAYGLSEAVCLLKLFKIKKMKLIVTYHMDTVGNGWKGVIFKIYKKLAMPIILASADAVLCSSFDYMLNSDAKNIFLRHRSKFYGLPFGVDEKFIPKLKDKSWQEKIGVKILYREKKLERVLS